MGHLHSEAGPAVPRRVGQEVREPPPSSQQLPTDCGLAAA